MAPASAPRPYRAPGLLGTALIVLLGLDAALAWLSIQATLFLAELAWQALSGHFLPGTALGAFAAHLGYLRLAQVLAAVATGVLFLAWFHRMWGNLPALGARAGEPPARAIAGFLVPGRNLVAPPRLVGELWRASDPRPALARPGLPLAVGWWWGLLLASLAVEAALRLAGLSRGPAAPAVSPAGALVAQALRLAAAVMAMAVVLRVTRYQEERRSGEAGAGPGGER